MRTLVVSDDALDALSSRLRGSLRTLLDAQGPASADYESAEQVLLQIQAELVVVVLSPQPERGLAVLRSLRDALSGPLFAMGPAADAKIILGALQCGADHYLDQDDFQLQLEAALQRLKVKQEVAVPLGRLVAVLAASGGTGVSTLAVNIATVLAKDQQKAALLDLNPGRGDLGSLLDLRPRFTLADLCLNAARLDRAMFEKMLVAHDSGVHLLGAQQMFGDARVVTAKGVGQALQLARTYFPQVVVDLEDCFHEEQVVTLRQATSILLVARLDFTSLRNARRILEHFHELDIPRHRAQLVINRHGQANELPVADAEDALGEKLLHFVPDDPKTVNGANNAGVPVVLRAPGSKVAQSITKLARTACERRRPEPVAAVAAS